MRIEKRKTQKPKSEIRNPKSNRPMISAGNAPSPRATAKYIYKPKAGKGRMGIERGD
jgi:hypothetical protein